MHKKVNSNTAWIEPSTVWIQYLSY